MRRIDADTEICCGEQKQLRKQREFPRRQQNMPRVGGCPRSNRANVDDIRGFLAFSAGFAR
jgi:hypothetical protein